jgi:outer membrane protein TolC
VAIAEEAVRNAEELVKITTDFAEGGQGLQADADRARVEAASRRRGVLLFQEERAVVSSELSRILRLDAAMRLAPAEETPAPIEFIPPAASLRPLISQAVGTRPEVRRADAERDAACYRVKQEKYRPWLPHLYVGASGGGFGGGTGSDVDNFDDRADYDAAAIWEVQNFGFGNAALRRETRSLYRQADLTVQQVRDVIASEVAAAYQRMQLRLQQIEVTKPQVETAQQALRLNLEGIRGGELRPIEIQQAIGALAAAQGQYLDALIDYNLAQLQLLRAIGRPPEVFVAGLPFESP